MVVQPPVDQCGRPLCTPLWSWTHRHSQSLPQTQSEVMGGGVGGTVGCSYTHCPTVNPTLLITLTPPSLSSAMQLSHPYKTFPSPHTLPTCPSVQFKFIAASMSSTGVVRGWKLWILFPIYQHGSGNVNN